MLRFDPTSPQAFGHGGTFNNNILSMAAGYVGLSKVLTKEASDRFNELGETLKQGMQARLDAHKVAACTTGYGSLFNLHFLPAESVSPAAVEAADRRPGQLWDLEMMLASPYVTRRGMIAMAVPHSSPSWDTMFHPTVPPFWPPKI